MITELQKPERGPIVAIMGHIDHGKSTLLSYIRKSNKPIDEAGGITQHISTYEVEHETKEGKKYCLTFLDTPGHEAFSGIRVRGAKVANVAVLVVSAEDGVKPQTLEALRAIKESNTPYIVAITKIDKPEANVERTKQSLAENEIYIEGYGGDVPYVTVSSKTGEGIPELLDLIVLASELEGLSGTSVAPAEGVIIESHRDVRKGLAATAVIKNGSIQTGDFAASGTSVAPVRIMENYKGQPIAFAQYRSPVIIIGWDNLPKVGDAFKIFKNRDEARAYAENNKKTYFKTKVNEENLPTLPLIIRADTSSSLEAVTSQIEKLKKENFAPKIISSGIGPISENDIRLAQVPPKALVVGFNISTDAPAKSLADRSDVEVFTFDIIYKLTEWLAKILTERAPKVTTHESKGIAKILKIFSKVKDRQILGARVEKGAIALGSQVKIIRRDAVVGDGRVRELQVQKTKTDEVAEGKEFGALIEAKMEIAPGDRIESFVSVLK